MATPSKTTKTEKSQDVDLGIGLPQMDSDYIQHELNQQSAQVQNWMKQQEESFRREREKQQKRHEECMNKLENQNVELQKKNTESEKTLTHAYKELQRLQDQIKELMNQKINPAKPIPIENNGKDQSSKPPIRNEPAFLPNSDNEEHKRKSPQPPREQQKFNPFEYSPYYQPQPQNIAQYKHVDEIISTYDETETLSDVFQELYKVDPTTELQTKAKAGAMNITKMTIGDKTELNQQVWDRDFSNNYREIMMKLVTKMNDKVPDCDIRFYGNPMRDEDELSTLVKKFQSWVKLNNVPSSKWLGVWVTQILQGQASKIYYRRTDDINGNLSNLLQFLQTAFAQKHRLHQIKHRIQTFQRKDKEPFPAYIQRFITLIEDFIWDFWVCNS